MVELNGNAVFELEHSTARLRYTIELDAGWQVQHARVHCSHGGEEFSTQLSHLSTGWWVDSQLRPDLAYHPGNPTVTTVLTAPSNPEHAEQNVTTQRRPLPNAVRPPAEQAWQHHGGVHRMSLSTEQALMPAPFSARRRKVSGRLLALAMTGLALCSSPNAWAQTGSGDGWGVMHDGTAVLFRHATAPGGGDPPGFRLGDCATQRNLDESGRTQARRIGQAFKERGIRVGAVVSSQWCRARDTALLAFGAAPREVPAFNSFFDTPDQREAQTATAQRFLATWRGPGVLIVITHQVNISALTGIAPASGEGVVVRAGADGLRVLGKVLP